MHIFIGGAYNGKRQFVENWLKEIGVTNVGLYDGVIPKDVIPGKTIVIRHLEFLLREFDLSDEVSVATNIFEQLVALDRQHTLIVILTDIGRGVVPIDVQTRQLRDACGRLYQLLIKESEHVTRIWYGLSEVLK